MQQMQAAGRMVAGMRQSLRAVNAGKAMQLYVAADADARMRDEACAAAKAAGVPVQMCESMTALQHMCRISVPCAVAAQVAED